MKASFASLLGVSDQTLLFGDVSDIAMGLTWVDDLEALLAANDQFSSYLSQSIETILQHYEVNSQASLNFLIA